MKLFIAIVVLLVVRVIQAGGVERIGKPEAIKTANNVSETLTKNNEPLMLIGILGTGALSFLMRCTKKDANHSHSRATRATDIALLSIVMWLAMAGAAYCRRDRIEHNRPYSGRSGDLTSFLAYISMVVALSSTTIPDIANVIGEKYKWEGYFHMKALRQSKRNGSFTTKGMTVNTTLSDYYIANEGAPTFIAIFVGLGYTVLVSPPVGISALGILALSHMMGFHCFYKYLAEDYALVGSRGNPWSTTGMAEIGNKILLVRLMMLSASSAVICIYLPEPVGMLATYILIIVWCVVWCAKPEWLREAAYFMCALSSTQISDPELTVVIVLSCILSAIAKCIPPPDPTRMA